MQHARSQRAGHTFQHPNGYIAFAPASLPPVDLDLVRLQEPLAAANLALGRLDAVGELLPKPEIFLAMYVRKEAVLSAQIEGTQASLSDVLNREADLPSSRDDVGDILNYIAAMNGGLEAIAERAGDLLFDDAFIGWLHRTVIQDTRGDGMHAGGYRRVQNWIGGGGRTETANPLDTAVYVPPPPEQVSALMTDLFAYMNDRGRIPPLIRAGVAHCQFETIHPFIDGNGRLGRLLVTLMLCASGTLRRPLLYLSAYFKEHRREYYERLTAVRVDGDWEGWLEFFLAGVASAAHEGFATAVRVRDVLQEDARTIDRDFSRRAYARPLLDLLARQPRVSPSFVAKRLNCTPGTATTTLRELSGAGILAEVTGREWGKVYEYRRYMDALEPRGE